MQQMHAKVNEMVAEFEELRREYDELKMHNYRIELSNDNMRNSLNSGNGKETYELWENNKKLEIQKLERMYFEKMQKQDEEHKNLLEEIDTMMLEQEKEIGEIKQQKEELQVQNEALKKELATEKEEKTLIMKKMNNLNESITSQSSSLVKYLLLQNLI